MADQLDTGLSLNQQIKIRNNDKSNKVAIEKNELKQIAADRTHEIM